MGALDRLCMPSAVSRKTDAGSRDSWRATRRGDIQLTFHSDAPGACASHEAVAAWIDRKYFAAGRPQLAEDARRRPLAGILVEMIKRVVPLLIALAVAGAPVAL